MSVATAPPSEHAPHFRFPPGTPLDCVPIRQAEALLYGKHSVSVRKIRKWIRDGLGNRKLSTYRSLGNADVVFVSPDEIAGFAKRAKFLKKKPVRGSGLTSFTLDEQTANQLRTYTALLRKRLGVKLSMPQAVGLLLTEALRREGQ